MSADLTNYKHPIIQFDQRQMYEFGEGKTLLKQSEVRPEGFSYYNRVYNSHETGGASGQGQIYHEGEYERYQEAEDHEGEHERYQEAGADHHEHQGHQYYPAKGQLSGGDISASGSTDIGDRGFEAEPDVTQYYHFQSQQRKSPQAPYIPSYARASENEGGDYHSVQGEPVQENYQHYQPAQSDHRSSPPPVYEEDHHSEKTLNRFSQGSSGDIEYPDVQFYDDFDDYGIEMEFENELRRLTEVVEDERGRERSGGQRGYLGSDLRPRVYVGGSEDYGEDLDFHYPSDFSY